MKEVQIVALSTSESSPGNYAIVLEELELKKRMVIIIGAFEAQSIAVYLERMQLPRPLTHDVFKATIDALGAQLTAVQIHSIYNNMFLAWLVLKTINNEEKKVDVRASDALAMAVRFECPILVDEKVLTEAILLEDPKKYSLIKGSLADYTIEELESLLQNVLDKEDYESAMRIRDMIKRKTG